MLELTPHGDSLLAQIHHEWHEIDREINALIGEENADGFAAYSLQLLKAFGGSPPGDDGLEHDTEVSPRPRTTA